MTGTAGIVGIGGMGGDIRDSHGHHLGQDYSQGHVLDAAMDRSSRGTAATAANTISGNINRSGGNINYRPAGGGSGGIGGIGARSSGDNIQTGSMKYSNPHQAY